MNYSSAIFLVNKDVRAVLTSYERDTEGKGVKPWIPYKSMNHDLKPGDYVVVPTDTRHQMTVVRVEAIEDDVDPASPVQLKWIIDGVEMGAYNEILTAEAGAIERIKSAEKRAAREELANKLLADNPDIQALSNLGAQPALAPPAPE